jgi:hypothetical protein
MSLPKKKLSKKQTKKSYDEPPAIYENPNGGNGVVTRSMRRNNN